jgi:hypothetical protein
MEAFPLNSANYTAIDNLILSEVKGLYNQQHDHFLLDNVEDGLTLPSTIIKRNKLNLWIKTMRKTDNINDAILKFSDATSYTGK